ncbi:hypothetical protein HNS55_004221 [Salmonella enterica]|nr:hypothetical protein [Salmonella enterica]EFO8529205.1 hypothetical protein [Salmonella enterica]
MNQQDPYTLPNGRQISSEVLLQLRPEQLPSLPIACKACHMGRWMATRGAIRCYCTMTFAYMWDSSKPTDEILDCDGLYLQEDDPSPTPPVQEPPVNISPESEMHDLAIPGMDGLELNLP